MEILTEWDSVAASTDRKLGRCRDDLQASEDTPKIEDHPEPGDVTALGGLGRIRHHDGTLGAPQ